jgi:hypothetical protein
MSQFSYPTYSALGLCAQARHRCHRTERAAGTEAGSQTPSIRHRGPPSSGGETHAHGAATVPGRSRLLPGLDRPDRGSDAVRPADGRSDSPPQAQRSAATVASRWTEACNGLAPPSEPTNTAMTAVASVPARGIRGTQPARPSLARLAPDASARRRPNAGAVPLSPLTLPIGGPSWHPELCHSHAPESVPVAAGTGPARSLARYRLARRRSLRADRSHATVCAHRPPPTADDCHRRCRHGPPLPSDPVIVAVAAVASVSGRGRPRPALSTAATRLQKRPSKPYSTYSHARSSANPTLSADEPSCWQAGARLRSSPLARRTGPSPRLPSATSDPANPIRAQIGLSYT